MGDDVLQYMREKDPRFKNVSDDDLKAYIQANHPDLAKAIGQQKPTPSFTPISSSDEAMGNALSRQAQAIEDYRKFPPAGLVGALNASYQGAMANTGLAGVGDAIGKIPVVGDIARGVGGAFDWAGRGLAHLSMLPYGNFGTTQENADLLRSNVEEAGGNLAPWVIPGAVGEIAPKVIGGMARMGLPQPEALYSKAANLGSVAKSDLSAASRGVEERIPIKGRYSQVLPNYEAIQSQKNAIFNNEINPKIQALQDKGLSSPTKDISQSAVDWVREKSPDLKGPDKAEFSDYLNQLKENFDKNNGETLTPKAMQEMKTAVHARVPFEKMSGVANEFNKAVGSALRSTLESWDEGLKPLNQRWADLNTLSESQKAIGDKSGNMSKSPMSSMPFYMAVGEPFRGAMLSEMRGLTKLPETWSRAAFAVDRLQKLGIPDASKIGVPFGQVTDPVHGRTVEAQELQNPYPHRTLPNEAPMDEAPKSMGGDMNVRGRANQETINNIDLSPQAYRKYVASEYNYGRTPLLYSEWKAKYSAMKK